MTQAESVQARHPKLVIGYPGNLSPGCLPGVLSIAPSGLGMSSRNQKIKARRFTLAGFSSRAGYSGGFNSPAIHPALSDFIGS